MKVFYIDFVRQILEQTFLNEHIKDNNLVGGKNQLNLFSFYEQLEEREQVDRYVEYFNELVNQQNRTDLIANGILSAPENPSITNLNKHLIIPLSYVCAFRIALKDRDSILDTINNLISILKGRKVDIAEFDNGKLFMVGTLGNNVDGTPLIRVGDFIGVKVNTSTLLDTWVNSQINALTDFTWENFGNRSQYLYYEESGKLKVAYNNNGEWEEIEDDNSYDDIIFPPSHNSFTKYKVSLSFDSTRCDTPRSLDAEEVITISFGGSATIVDSNVLLGNDLTKLSIAKYGLVDANGTNLISGTPHWLEPLEMPSGNNADTQLNKLMSNNFIANSHTDSLQLAINYTFIVDLSNNLIAQWFLYARYGKNGFGQPYVTPNLIYSITEIFSSWGVVYKWTYLGKIVESIDIENTESDTLTIALQFQVQGANN